MRSNAGYVAIAVAVALADVRHSCAQIEKAAAPQGVKALESAGPKAALALYPVRVLGRPDRNVANVLGLVLEKYGMENLDAVDAAFIPPSGQTWEEVARGFADFVKLSPPKSANALYAEYLGDRQRGPTEVRWVLVNVGGNVLLTDRQTQRDADFRRTAASDPDPMGCSVLVAERLFSQLHWKKSSGPAKADGKFARLWAEKSGTPDEKELAEMKRRTAQLKAALKTARVGIYATRVGDAPNADSAVRLAKTMPQELGCQTIAVDKPMPTKIVPTSNEQKRLWDLARAFREHLRANPPETDYAILAEFLLNPVGEPAHSVHVVVCDKSGDWVIVDFQNNQHEDFRRIAPKSVEDCERLTVERIALNLK